MTIDLPEGGVLAAVSGGADSVAMLRMLVERREHLRAGVMSESADDSIRTKKRPVAAAHYNHGLRPSADGDEAFVRGLCADWGIPFITERGDVAGEAKRRGKGIEETARIMRYEFLERARVESGMDWIATAHTADDNVETVLLNLTRGAGLTGLCGIPPVRGNIIRPLLAVTRDEIIAYLEERGIPHREDESNADTAYRRNYIRCEVIPALRRCNPALTDAVMRTIHLLRGDEEYLSSFAGEEWGLYGSVGCGIPDAPSAAQTASFPAKRLCGLPLPVASRVCRMLAGLVGGYPPERVHISAMLDIAAGGNGRQTDLPGSLTAVKLKGNLTVYKKP